MKRILITGKNSYIGTSVEKWFLKEPEQYQLTTLDMKNGMWKDHDFSKYDVVFHVAGIAHIKESKKNKHLYYLINRDLAVETAKKAKIQGVSQFIFLSSMSVYGIEQGVVSRLSELNPRSAYGKSKLEAENLIRNLENKNFRVVILRPPMVYGKNCRGNYQKLAKFARIIPIFPKVNNKRSMVYIDVLSEFVKLIIDENMSGLFLPQNSEYVNTSEMIRLIAKAHGKKIIIVDIFEFMEKIFVLGIFKKIFGSLVYEYDNESLNAKVSKTLMISLEETIRRTELG